MQRQIKPVAAARGAQFPFMGVSTQWVADEGSGSASEEEAEPVGGSLLPEMGLSPGKKTCELGS